MTQLVLVGLDGSNPLGLFAAVGVLEALASQSPAARLGWRDEGAWRPVVADTDLSTDALLEALDRDRQSCASDPALALEYEGTRDLKPPPGVYRRFLSDLVTTAEPTRRRGVDWAAAFATDTAVDNNGNTKPTAFHFTAGNQLWLAMVRELVSDLTVDDLREALFGPWRYERKLPVLGWDATVARDYALRASNPAKDKKTGVPGADWLAVRGLASLGVAPRGNRVVTTGCSVGWKTGTFTWPLWEATLGVDMVRTTLRMAGLADLSDTERRSRGIGIVFRSGIRRSDQGGYGGFTPAEVI